MQLEPVLNAQTLLSSCGGKITPVHDEHLFIVTHQSKHNVDYFVGLLHYLEHFFFESLMVKRSNNNNNSIIYS